MSSTKIPEGVPTESGGETKVASVEQLKQATSTSTTWLTEKNRTVVLGGLVGLFFGVLLAGGLIVDARVAVPVLASILVAFLAGISRFGLISSLVCGVVVTALGYYVGFHTMVNLQGMEWITVVAGGILGIICGVTMAHLPYIGLKSSASVPIRKEKKVQ